VGTSAEPPDGREELPVRCAWCGRTPVDGVWVAEAHAAHAVHEATHGICPECFAEQERQRKAAQRAARIYRKRGKS
jgi:hypothetical protein